MIFHMNKHMLLRWQHYYDRVIYPCSEVNYEIIVLEILCEAVGRRKTNDEIVNVERLTNVSLNVGNDYRLSRLRNKQLSGAQNVRIDLIDYLFEPSSFL